MYCPRCGVLNRNDVQNCQFCDAPLKAQRSEVAAGGTPAARLVRNYLAPAILITMFCCLPLGIVAIVYASRANGKLAGGDFEGALRDSETAKMWCLVALGLSLVPVAILLIAQGLSH